MSALVVHSSGIGHCVTRAIACIAASLHGRVVSALVLYASGISHCVVRAVARVAVSLHRRAVSSIALAAIGNSTRYIVRGLVARTVGVSNSVATTLLTRMADSRDLTDSLNGIATSNSRGRTLPLNHNITSQQPRHSHGDAISPLDLNIAINLLNPKRPGIRQLELQVVVAHGLELCQRRQLIQASQAEVVQELPRGAEQLGTAGYIAVANDAHPVPLDHGLHNIRIHGDTANRFDLGASDGLAVSDQGKRLEQRTRITRRSLRP